MKRRAGKAESLALVFVSDNPSEFCGAESENIHLIHRKRSPFPRWGRLHAEKRQSL